MNRKLLVILAGTSAVGKDKTEEKLYAKLTELKYNVKNLQKYTTRGRRPNEIKTSKYIHLSKNEIEELFKLDIIFSRQDSNKYIYGLDSQFCLNCPSDTILLYNIRLLENISEIENRAIKEGLKVLKILLHSDFETLKKRIVKRSVSTKEATTRIDSTKKDLLYLKTNNDSLRSIFDLYLRSTFEQDFYNNVFSILNLIRSNREV